MDLQLKKINSSAQLGNLTMRGLPDCQVYLDPLNVKPCYVTTEIMLTQVTANLIVKRKVVSFTSWSKFFCVTLTHREKCLETMHTL